VEQEAAVLSAARHARRTVARWRSTTDPGDWDHREALDEIVTTVDALLP
jgi:hypothetical protein